MVHVKPWVCYVALKEVSLLPFHGGWEMVALSSVVAATKSKFFWPMCVLPGSTFKRTGVIRGMQPGAIRNFITACSSPRPRLLKFQAKVEA